VSALCWEDASPVSIINLHKYRVDTKDSFEYQVKKEKEKIEKSNLILLK
jgi:hypothetical protein